MTKERVCANGPRMSRRNLLAAAPALGLIGLPLPALARAPQSFEQRAEEIASMMRAHFRTNLPEGCQRYSVQIYDSWDLPPHPNAVGMMAFAAQMNWTASGHGWH